MPLRDLFHPPLELQCPWEGFHSAWANMIVRHLNSRWLPPRYRAIPQIHAGMPTEADVSALEIELPEADAADDGGGTATAVWAPPAAAQTMTVDFADEDTYEVRVHDPRRNMRLVAVVELVSPRNKDRAASRRAFAQKCAGFLRQGVSVVVVDVVTERHGNLHHELLQSLELPEPLLVPAGALYAVSYRPSKPDEHWRIDLWPEVLTVGTVLPTLPLWLSPTLSVPVQLEETFEETLELLRLA